MTAATPRTRAVPLIASALRPRARVVALELLAFGGVGGISFIVDAGGFNLLRATLLPDHVVTAKVISVVASVVVAWFGSRYLTYRNRPRRAAAGEIALFVAANAASLAISVATLAFSHYVLGLTDAVSDNISGNVVGVALGTVLRFVLYRSLVFRTQKGSPA